jgi:hypothetical protein
VSIVRADRAIEEVFMKRIISSVVGIGVLAMTVAASAQTLADLAKKDTDRRRTVKHPAKVYTNDDVQDVKPILPMMENDGTGTRPVDPAAAGAQAGGGNPDMPGSDSGSAKGGAAAATAAKGDAAPKPAGTPGVKAGDESAWRGRLNAAKEAVSRTQLQLESMRNRAAQLTAQSAAANDQNRGTFQKQQQDALQEYDKLRADLERNQKALADVQSEATRAGVPPGWLR